MKESVGYPPILRREYVKIRYNIFYNMYYPMYTLYKNPIQLETLYIVQTIQATPSSFQRIISPPATLSS